MPSLFTSSQTSGLVRRKPAVQAARYRGWAIARDAQSAKPPPFPWDSCMNYLQRYLISCSYACSNRLREQTTTSHTRLISPSLSGTPTLRVERIAFVKTALFVDVSVTATHESDRALFFLIFRLKKNDQDPLCRFMSSSARRKSSSLSMSTERSRGMILPLQFPSWRWTTDIKLRRRTAKTAGVKL